MMTTTSELRTVSVPSCQACGQEGRRVYAGLSDLQTSLAGGWCVSRCGTLWLDPRPDPRDPADRCTGDYYTHDQPLDDWDTRLIRARSLGGTSFSHCLRVELFARFVGMDPASCGSLFRRLRKNIGMPFELVEAGMRMFYPMAGDEIVMLLARWEDRDVGSRG